LLSSFAGSEAAPVVVEVVETEALEEVVEVAEEAARLTNLAQVEVVVTVGSSVSRSLILEEGWEVSRSQISAAFSVDSKNPLYPRSAGSPNPVMELPAVVSDSASQT